MARNTVHCKLCSKAFFPGSIEIHMKQCVKKMALVPVPCQYCREEYPHGEMPQHHTKCKPALAAKRELARGQASMGIGGGGGSGSGGGSGIRAPARSSQGTGRNIVGVKEPQGNPRSSSNNSNNLASGSRVECVGLQKKPEMNGQRGIILGPGESSGADTSVSRWSVRLEDGRGPFNLKPENLRVLGGGSDASASDFPAKTLGSTDGGYSGGSGIGGGGGSMAMGGGGGGMAMGAVAGGEEGDFGSFMSCGVCGRRFAMDRVATHQRICSKLAEKNKSRPRRVFDPKKGRVDPEAMAAKRAAGPPPPPPTSKWRREHRAFQDVLRASRNMSKSGGGSGSGGGGGSGYSRGQGSSSSSGVGGGYGGGSGYDNGMNDDEDDGRVPCPHCGRKFAQLTAARHIPKCAETINKPKPPPRLSPTKLQPSAMAAVGRGGSGRGGMGPGLGGGLRGEWGGNGGRGVGVRGDGNGKGGRGVRPRTSGSAYNGGNVNSGGGGGGGGPSASAGANRGIRALPSTTTAGAATGGDGGNGGSSSVSVGSRIIVVGTARNDVNGLSGIATGFDQQGGGSSSDGRFVVTLEDGRVVGLRAANLVPDPRPQPAANGRSPLLGEVDDLSSPTGGGGSGGSGAGDSAGGFPLSRSPRQQRASGSGAAAVAALQRNHQSSRIPLPGPAAANANNNAAAATARPLGQSQLPPMRPRSAGQSRSSNHRG